MTQKGAPMPFEKSVVVPLNADETFALITEPDRLRRWQVVTARVDLRAGGDYRWTIVPGHSAGGTITEVEPGKRVVFTWGWEGSADLPPGSSTVIITLEPSAGGTLVRLVHEGLTDEQAASHGEGWNHYLDRLVSGRDRRRRRGRRVGGGAGVQPDHLRRGDARHLPARAARRREKPTITGRRRAPSSTHPASRSPDRFDHRARRRRGRPVRRGRGDDDRVPGRRGGPGGARGLERPRPGRRDQGRPARDARRAGPWHPLDRVPRARLGLRAGHRPAGHRSRWAQRACSRRGRADHQAGDPGQGRLRRPG